MFYKLLVGSASQYEIDRIYEYRFARAGLSCKNIEAVAKTQFDLIYERYVFYV